MIIVLEFFLLNYMICHIYFLEDMFFCLQVLVKTRYVQGVNLFGYLYDCTSSTSTTRCTSLRHYVKNYQDSVLIQGSIKRMADSILLMSRWKKAQAYFGGVQHSYRAPNLVKNTYRYKKTICRK